MYFPACTATRTAGISTLRSLPSHVTVGYHVDIPIMSHAVETAKRTRDGVYESPFGKQPNFQKGTLYDYTCGTLSWRQGEPGFEKERALYDVVSKQSWTVEEKRRDVILIAATLLKVYTCKPGDHVMICYPTSAVFALLCFACARAGLVMALANPAYTADEMKHACTLVGAKLILTVEQFLPSLEKGGIDSTSIVDATYPTPRGGRIDKKLFRDLIGSVEEAEAILKGAGANNIDWKTACGIFFSSGTTGLPKAVMVSHYNLIALCHAVKLIPGHTPPKTWDNGKPSSNVVYLPAFHIAGMAGLTIGAVEGGCVWFSVANPIDLKLIVSTIKEARPWVSELARSSRT